MSGFSFDKYLDPNNHGWYLDEDGVSWEDPEAWLRSKVMGFCGCGPIGYLTKQILPPLRLLAKLKACASYEEQKPTWELVNQVPDTIWYVLDKLELTEHGSSIPGWLTESGRVFLADLEELARQEAEADGLAVT